MSKKQDISILIDNVGRTIVGRIKKTKDSIEVENPTVVNIQVNKETGQMAVQLIPYVFKEFLVASQREGSVTWKFPKNLVVLSDDIEIDEQLKQQYENVFATPPVAQAAPQPAPQPATEQSEPEVVKLFDE